MNILFLFVGMSEDVPNSLGTRRNTHHHSAFAYVSRSVGCDIIHSHEALKFQIDVKKKIHSFVRTVPKAQLVVHFSISTRNLDNIVENKKPNTPESHNR